MNCINKPAFAKPDNLEDTQITWFGSMYGLVCLTENDSKDMIVICSRACFLFLISLSSPCH